MTDPHLEAAAAAIRIMVNPAEAIARAVITAYHASLAAAGEAGLVEAMDKAFWNMKGNPTWLDQMRAALAVVRAADGERVEALSLAVDAAKLLIEERTARAEAAEARVKSADDNARYIIENWLPATCVVRVCEGGGPEDLQASLAVSVEKTISALRGALKTNEELEARERALREALLREAEYCYGYAKKYEATDEARAARHRARGDRLKAEALKEPQS